MVNTTFSAARQWPNLVLVLAIWFSIGNLANAQVATALSEDQDLLSFPSQCGCSLTLTCNCCQSAVFMAMDVNKTLCMTFQVNILQASVDVTITLDGNNVSQFTLDAKTTPSFCLPVVSQITPMAVCLKMSTKMSDLMGVNICPSFYSSFSENQLLAFDFSCLKLSMDGISLA